MTGLSFWQKWQKPFRYVFLLLLALFGACLLYATYHYFEGNNITYRWEQLPVLDNVRITTDTFTKNNFEYSTQAESYLIFERFTTADLHLPAYQTYIHVFLLVIALAAMLTAVTYFSYYWYFASMGLFMYFLTTLKVELLSVFGLSENILLLIMIALFAGLSYYFYSFNTKASIILRFIAFLIILLAIGVFINAGATTNASIVHLSRYSIIVPLGLTLLFVLLVSSEIIKGFVWLATHSGTGIKNRSTFNFIVISALYLLNLLLAFFKNRNIIDWNFIYIGAFPLLLVSAVLGIWGFPKRKPVIAKIVDNDQAISLLYVALGITSFATLGFIYGTANDALITVAEELIILTHLCLGFAFFVYILFNFVDLMAKGLPVHKVMYQPMRMPFYALVMLGLVACAIFILQTGFFLWYDLRGGYQTLIGDVYREEGNILLADQYYKKGLEKANYNHRAAYALATMARAHDDKPSTLYYFQRATSQHPTPQAFIGLSNYFADRNQFYDAIFILKDGIREFPQSPELLNNLGVMFSNAQVLDSAYYFFDQAIQHQGSTGIANSNLLAFMAKYQLLDSIPKDLLTGDDQHLAYVNNKLVMQSLIGQTANEALNTRHLNDSLLNNESFAYIYNYGLNHMKQPDSAFVQRLDKYRATQANRLYAEDLNFVRAHLHYYSGETAQAVEMLAEAARNTTVLNDLYYNQLGLWLMRKEAWNEAVKYFELALNRGYEGAPLNLALAFSEAGDMPNAIRLWQLIRQQEDSLAVETSNIMLTILVAPAEHIQGLSDDLKLQAIHFNKYRYTPAQVEAILASVSNPVLVPLVRAKVIEYYLQRNDVEAAQRVFNAMPAITDRTEGKKEINEVIALLLLHLGNYDALNQLVQSSAQPFNENYFEEYVQARLKEHSGDTAAARKLYQSATLSNPFYAEAVIHAARFMQEVAQQPEQAYEILAFSLRLNPDDIAILKAYTLQSLRLRLTNYAYDGLNRLRQQLPPAELEDFERSYREIYHQITQEEEIW